LVVVLIVVGILLWLVETQLPIAQPIKTIIQKQATPEPVSTAMGTGTSATRASFDIEFIHGIVAPRVTVLPSR
jgi:hypothetical protein